MACIYVFSDSRFNDRVKFGRCGNENKFEAECLRLAWSYTPARMSALAIWCGDNTAVKECETYLKRSLDEKKVDRRFPSASDEAVFIPVDVAIEFFDKEISQFLGSRARFHRVSHPTVSSKRPDFDNLRHPPPHLLEKPNHACWKQVVWIYEEEDTEDGLHRVKTSRMNDWAAPHERHKRYSVAGLRTVSGFTYSLDAPASSDGNLAIERAVQTALKRYGDIDAYVAGWTRPETTIKQLEALYETELGLKRVVETRPVGVRKTYNKAE